MDDATELAPNVKGLVPADAPKSGLLDPNTLFAAVTVVAIVEPKAVGAPLRVLDFGLVSEITPPAVVTSGAASRGFADEELMVSLLLVAEASGVSWILAKMEPILVSGFGAAKNLALGAVEVGAECGGAAVVFLLLLPAAALRTIPVGLVRGGCTELEEFVVPKGNEKGLDSEDDSCSSLGLVDGKSKVDF